ncbi:hypothetical protein F4678DRAFT_484652 [Xylaria arbuscula]|nr:hypothetical protein F4678DRAFT_484652 [Xylaria arbuscula]
MVRPSQLRVAAAEAKLNSAGNDEETKPMDLEDAGKEFGDYSSTYWPAGWNFDRFSKASSLELLQELPGGEYSKLQTGIQEALDEPTRRRLSGYLVQLARKKIVDEQATGTLAALQAQTNPVTSDWLRQWTRRHRDRGWGFVVVKTATPASTVTEDASAAKAKLELRWIEDPALDGQTDPDMLRDRYSQIRPSIPSGQSQDVFLVASKDAIASVLDDDNDQKTDEAAPFTNLPPWRSKAPYILAVSADEDLGLEEGHEEREWFKPVFRVAAEVLVDEFWHLLDLDFMPLGRITRNIKGMGLNGQVLAIGDHDDDLEDLWWSMAPSPQRLRKRRRVE